MFPSFFFGVVKNKPLSFCGFCLFFPPALLTEHLIFLIFYLANIGLFLSVPKKHYKTSMIPVRHKMQQLLTVDKLAFILLCLFVF